MMRSRTHSSGLTWLVILAAVGGGPCPLPAGRLCSQSGINLPRPLLAHGLRFHRPSGRVPRVSQRYLDIALGCRVADEGPAATRAVRLDGRDDRGGRRLVAGRYAGDRRRLWPRSGQDSWIAALPHSQTPTLNRQEWQTMLHWVPEDLWQRCVPGRRCRSDVNGFPRAGRSPFWIAESATCLRESTRTRRRAHGLGVLVEDA